MARMTLRRSHKGKYAICVYKTFATTQVEILPFRHFEFFNFLRIMNICKLILASVTVHALKLSEDPRQPLLSSTHSNDEVEALFVVNESVGTEPVGIQPDETEPDEPDQQCSELATFYKREGPAVEEDAERTKYLISYLQFLRDAKTFRNRCFKGNCETKVLESLKALKALESRDKYTTARSSVTTLPDLQFDKFIDGWNSVTVPLLREEVKQTRLALAETDPTWSKTQAELSALLVDIKECNTLKNLITSKFGDCSKVAVASLGQMNKDYLTSSQADLVVAAQGNDAATLNSKISQVLKETNNNLAVDKSNSMAERVLSGVVGAGIESIGFTIMAGGKVTMMACALAGIPMKVVLNLIIGFGSRFKLEGEEGVTLAVILFGASFAFVVGLLASLAIDVAAGRADYAGLQLALTGSAMRYFSLHGRQMPACVLKARAKKYWEKKRSTLQYAVHQINTFSM